MLGDIGQDRLEYIRELERRLNSAQESVLPYRTLVEDMSEGAIVLAPDRSILFCNHRFAATLGMPADRLLGRAFDDFIVPEDAPALASLLDRARRCSAQGEIHLLGSAGTPLPSSLAAATSGACVIVKDVTQPNQNHEIQVAWRLLEEAAVPLLLVDPSGKIIRANRAAQSLANQSLLSREFDDVFHLKAWPYARILAAAQSRPIEHLELTALQSDNRILDLLLSAAPLFDDASRLLGCALTLIDIAPRRRAEDALRRTSHRLELAHRAAGAGTWDYDILTGRVGWSSELFDLFGIDPHSVAPSMELFFSVIHHDDREIARTRIEQAIGDHADAAAEYRVVLPGERIRWIRSFVQGTHPAAGICIDITARVLAEREIHHSRSQLEAAFHAIQGGVMVFDMQGEAILVNDAMARITGFPTAGSMKRNLAFFAAAFDLRHLDGTPLPVQQRPASRVVRGESFADCRLRARRLDDGQESFLSFGGAPVYDRAGNQILAVIVTRDITIQMRMEEELRQRAEEVEKVMDLAPVAIWVAHDPLCRIITGNLAANQLFELADGTNVSASPPPHASPPQLEFFRNGSELNVEELPMQVAAARGEDVRDAEIEVRSRGGRRLTLWGHASPLRDAAGQVRGCVGAFLDVTQTRQRADAALRESEERFQATADTTPMMIWVAGADGACQIVNKAWLNFTGRTLEGARGFAWTDCIHPDDLQDYLHTRTSALRGRHSYQAEYRMRRADGEYRWVIAHAAPRLRADGVFIGLVGSCMDVTDIKRAQQEDLARQKLESVGTLAGGIAHDFNNLMGSALATTELALAEVADGVSPAESLQKIRDVAIRGAEIVRQLMIYAGQESPVRELVDVSRVVEEMVELLKISTSKQTVLKTTLGAGLPAVMASPAQLRQVVMNLVINASEAIGEGAGVIEVTTSMLAIGREGLSVGSERLPEGDYLSLSVSDTGCGMTPAAQARVFDPFFTTKIAGHGLGLAVVQGIVRVLGGAIRLASNHHGTTFEILLPCAAETAPTHAASVGAASAEEKRWESASVLVIEDEDTLRIAVSSLLRKAGFSVMETGDGLSGLDLLRNHRRDVGVMLLDVTLPGMPSQEILRQARQLRPDLRVILTSAYSEERVAESFGGAGFEGFIRKPYRLADLAAVLRG